MNILCIGDVVGESGCDFLEKKLRGLRNLYDVDVVIVNGENSVSNGAGITPKSAQWLFSAGADVITTGNHAFQRREVYDYFDETPFLIRPANYPAGAPGKGFCIFPLLHDEVAVINLMGTVFMDSLDNPFTVIESILPKIDSKIILVDFHAEATSEKAAMGAFLDGRVSAVFGTHTHVQTSDIRVQPGGTGFITDLGMVGAIHSSLGMRLDPIVKKFQTHLPTRFDLAPGPYMLNGALFKIDSASGHCIEAEAIRIE